MAALGGEQRLNYFGQFQLPAVNARAWLSFCYAERGLFVEGHLVGQEGQAIAEEANRPAILRIASWGLGLLHLRKGDLPKAILWFEQARDYSGEEHRSSMFSWFAPSLSESYAMTGNITDAMTLLTQVVQQVSTEETVDFQTLSCLALARVYVAADSPEEAHPLAEQALTLARERQERGNEAYALHLFGDMIIHGEPSAVDQAAVYYQQALALANELGMRPLQAHCYRGLGTLYSQTGQAEQARAELTTAIEMYREMEMTFWLPETEAALAAVEGR